MGIKSFAHYPAMPIASLLLPVRARRSWHDRRTKHSKEVAPVSSINSWTTATTPSGLAMPISGHAFGAAAARPAAAAAVRDRAGAVLAQLGLAQCDFPGTTAWRSPTC